MRKGLTMIETVIGITLIAVSFYILISIFMTLAPNTVRVEDISRKTYLAQEKTEEYLTLPFSTIASQGAASFPGNFSNYRYQIIVTYVTSKELNTPVAGPTDYKNIKVRVWGGSLSVLGTVEIVSLVSTYEVK